MEKITKIKNQIQKQKLFYQKNKTKDIYVTIKGYENYDDAEEEIIEGESIMDCLLENLERNDIILNLYDEMLDILVKEKKK